MKSFFVDLITTHETLFFRDKSPFKNIREVIVPKWLENSRSEPFNIYSAACSTGQEPVSVALLLRECLPPVHWPKVHIMGTDISDAVIAYAKNGVYSQYEVQRGMPTKLLMKYFTQKETSWELKDEVRSSLDYRQENLLQPYPKAKKFDLVLCRNVTIYMDKPKVRRIYEQLHGLMKPESHLIIGHSERMADHQDLFEYIRTPSGIIYQRK